MGCQFYVRRHCQEEANNCASSPLVRFWNRQFVNPIPREYVPEGFFETNKLEAFGFTRFQRAYLGVSGELFQKVLKDINRNNVNGKDALGHTLLWWAATRGDAMHVNRLLLRGAESNVQCRNDTTALHVTIQIGSLE